MAGEDGGGGGGGGELGRPNGESKEAGVLLFGLAHVAVINSKAQRSFHIRAGPYKKAGCGASFLFLHFSKKKLQKYIFGFRFYSSIPLPPGRGAAGGLPPGRWAVGTYM